jgi:hypothetical protein
MPEIQEDRLPEQQAPEPDPHPNQRMTMKMSWHRRDKDKKKQIHWTTYFHHPRPQRFLRYLRTMKQKKRQSLVEDPRKMMVEAVVTMMMKMTMMTKSPVQAGRDESCEESAR